MQSIKSLIDERAQSHGDELFALDPETAHSLTFAELRTAANAVARFLQNEGIQKGESVAFAFTNSPKSTVALLGIMYGGFRATAVNLVAGTATIGYVLSHSESKMVLTQEPQRALLESAVTAFEPPSTAKLVVCDDQWWSTIEQNEDAASAAILESDPLPEDDALLMYTSGTTGRPKGVVLSHRSLVASGENIQLAHNVTPEDRALCVLPVYHINGLCTTVIGPLYTASSVVYPEKFSTNKFWDWVRDHRCTWFSVVPTHIAYLAHNNDVDSFDKTGLEQVRFCRSASAPLSPDVQTSFETITGIPIIETMGLTETAGQILSNPMVLDQRKIGSPGVEVGDEVRIVDEKMQVVPAGEVGEVVVRGDNVLNRYFRNPEATAEALTEEGWLRTGDLGQIDSDGFVFITGRLKELIIKGGENIAPREIDESLYAHSSVVEAAAFACPCDRYGQRVEAAVSIKEGNSVTEAELLALCESTLGAFKTPDRIYFLDELPKGPSGKIQRLKLFEMFS